MGQTLTHGVYLPDEGERNCYNGLASNWSILDGAVGTIAEHTSALSGKAPLVHTHVKSDITDFPVYGTTAGTICEGNDSRLSDARTPVAHTHGKSDITDLFNSANTWTGQNTFKATVTYEGSFALYWKRSNLTAGTLPNSAIYYGTTRYTDSAGTTITLHRGVVNSSGRHYYTQTLYAFNDTSKSCSMSYGIDKDGANSSFTFNAERIIPGDNNATDLGTSDNKWKSLNGVNPGALSFPRIGTTANTDYIDVSGNIDLSTTASQTFTAPATGWFCISFRYDKVTLCRISAANMRGDCVPLGSDGYVGCYIPVTEGVTITVRVNATAIYNARIYLCQGNV